MSINQGAFQPGSAGSVVSKENFKFIQFTGPKFYHIQHRQGLAIFEMKKVELGISARNLVDADVFSKSDPMVVVEQQVSLFYTV